MRQLWNRCRNTRPFAPDGTCRAQRPTGGSLFSARDPPARRGEERRREAAALCALAREAVVGVHLGAVDVEMFKNICAPILPVGHRDDERDVGRISAHVAGGRGCGQPGGLLPVLTPGKCDFSTTVAE